MPQFAMPVGHSGGNYYSAKLNEYYSFPQMVYYTGLIVLKVFQ
jgi:hypothetical protein